MPPDLLSILTGALPELGTVGVALVVLYVFRQQMQSEKAALQSQMETDRTFFSEERTRIRTEAQEDIRLTREQAGLQRQELLVELREAKAETRAAEQELDAVRAQLYPGPQNPATASLPRSRHRAGPGLTGS